jgi:hypothetical protein
MTDDDVDEAEAVSDVRAVCVVLAIAEESDSRSSFQKRH